jgi:two-component system, NtrC family, sensor kinase
MRQRPKPAKSKAKVPVAGVRDLEKRLAEALARETTTSEILRVISQSQTDLQPVFEAIVRSATQLCEATFAVLHRFDGQVVTFDAHYGMTEQEVAGSRDRFPLPTDRETAVGRAILDRRTTHIHDIRRDAEYRVSAWQASFQTVLAVPLLRAGVPRWRVRPLAARGPAFFGKADHAR